MQAKKILIVRFSSIGDIVLTTPIIRCLKQQVQLSEIHFVCKKAFEETLIHNPYIDKLFTFTNDIDELYKELKAEKYDVIIDLHYNLRSLRLKRQLGVKALHFNKLNFKKFLAVNFKKIAVLPDLHIVDRYFKTVEALGVKSDGKGLDYFIPEKDTVNLHDKLIPYQTSKFIALVLGGSYYTKQIPINKLKEISEKARLPIVLLGSKSEIPISKQLMSSSTNLIDTCGQLSLNQSASVIQQAEWVITSDTGLMHIASAFNKKIISVWGNTIPQFGMQPYMANDRNVIMEVKKLNCRPCSKLGHKKCPLGHFNCMNHHDFSFLHDLV